MLVNRGEDTAVSLDLAGTDATEFEVSRINEGESLDHPVTVAKEALATLPVAHDEILLIKSK